MRGYIYAAPCSLIMSDRRLERSSGYWYEHIRTSRIGQGASHHARLTLLARIDMLCILGPLRWKMFPAT